jgi:asparagine synthase (glutamine-hydrolysing)
MCGFVGVLGGRISHDLSRHQELLKSMTDRIIHRGPDAEGYWWDDRQGIGLGHRRLSIIDLSEAGRQPMTSVSERFVIAFNGEIYNHLAIRSELTELGEAPIWRGHSDTETLLAAFEVFGVEATLKKSIGMFAFSLWDKAEEKLILARDRMGEKPLYYGWQGHGCDRTFLFGSELKALKAHPVFSAEINRGAICLLLRHNYIPAPHSIYHGISKLEPGSILSISLDNPEPKISKYWNFYDVVINAKSNTFIGSPEESVDKLQFLAKDAVRHQMVSDVPLGAFLSGGVDSSLVVALMQSESSKPIKTFTIGFQHEGYNEANHAKAVAKHLGTDHTELYVTPEEAMAVIPRLSSMYCEPFADSSQIPTFLVSKLASEVVKVSLSGDGGDELFCGYDRYMMTNKLWKKVVAVPMPFRNLVSKGITSISPFIWNGLDHYFQSSEHSSLEDKVNEGAKIISSCSIENLYLNVISHVRKPSEWVIGGIEPPTYFTGPHPKVYGLESIQSMMALDGISYLPDDILVKIDRAGMAASLEGRVPLLDHRIVEFAWSLPMKYKLNEGKSKWPLRQLLYKYVPPELVDRPKMGFGVPLDDWLRGPLRYWADALLAEKRLQKEGYFHSSLIRQKWTEHLSGKFNWGPQLWSVLMFQAWLEEAG